MPTAILLGVPPGYISEIKSALASKADMAADWKLQFVPSRNKWPSFFDSEIIQAMEFARRAGGGHILGYSIEKNRQQLARRIRSFFRFRWSDDVSLGKVGGDTEEFLKQLFLVELAEETEWIKSVKPRDLRSPTLLPESCFATGRFTEQMWRHIEASGPGNVDSAVAAVEKFGSIHLRKVAPEARFPPKYLWVDSKDRCFDHSQDRHGKAKFPFNWKYSFEIADGFHYDVRHLEGHSFQIEDIAGDMHHVERNAYINIDPHGSTRKGTAG